MIEDHTGSLYLSINKQSSWRKKIEIVVLQDMREKLNPNQNIDELQPEDVALSGYPLERL